MGGLIGIENIMKSFKYVSYIKISIGESIKIKVNGLLVITNWVRNYAPAFYLVNYGGPSYEHIAGRTFDSIDLAASFEEPWSYCILFLSIYSFIGGYQPPRIIKEQIFPFC